MADIEWTDLLFQFDGRINRAKFWIGVGIIVVAEIIVALVFFDAESDFGISPIGGLLLLALLWPSLAVGIKRWHDRDKSGWWVLIVFIPLIGGIWFWVETGFLQGTSGPNQYGPDPLARGLEMGA